MVEEIKLKVGELTGREDFGRGIARLDTKLMSKIGAKEGDILEIEGKNTTGAVAIRSYPADIGLNILRVDGLVRKNCDASIGETVTVRKSDVKETKKLILAPAQKGFMLHISPNLLKQNLYMRPMKKGDIIITNPVFKTSRNHDDIFSIFGIDIEEVFMPMGTEMRLVVVDAKPEGITKISDMTEVELLPEAVEVAEAKLPTVTYEDIGGLSQIIPKIREMIETPLRHPEIFERLGVEPPKGVLLHGPPGTGKTLIAKAVANEAGAHFISLAGPEIFSKWYGQSLPFNEELFILEDGIAKRKSIGEIVENGNKNIKVLAFDENGKINYSDVTDLIKHKNKSKILEVKTRSGRKIKVTDYHSLFTLKGDKIEAIKTSEIVPGETYIAIPRLIPFAKKQVTSINFLEALKEDDFNLVIRNSHYLKLAIEKVGHKKVANILGIKEKYLYDVKNKNIGIRVSKFLRLIKETDIEYKTEDIKISSKGKSLPPVIELTEDFCTFLGLWLAEGSYNKKETVRLSLNSKEAEEFKKLCERLFGYVTVYKNGNGTDLYITSRTLYVLMRHVLGFESGARNKICPQFIFSLPKNQLSAVLKGYFTGDGSIYNNQHGVPTIEAGTESEKLADDLMYLLLYFGIPAKRYERIEEDRHQYRICFTGADNLTKFKEISFLDNSKNDNIETYLNKINWRRCQQIPLTPEIKNIISNINQLKPWSNSTTIGENILSEFVDNQAVQSLINNDIAWDLVEEIKEVENEEFVYDISVEPTQNFVGGFGGIFAHNTEENLRKVFEDAEKNAPSIIFIDEIDSIAPKREQVTGEVERRTVSQLLTLMDGLQSRGKVVVIAATNRVNSLDPALRRGGRFDREIEIPVPDKKGRKEILQIHTRQMPLEKGIDLDKLSEITYGYVGSDISGLAKEAAMHALRRVIPEISALKEGEPIPKEILEKLKVTKEDFDYALRMVQPSGMREVLIEIPKVKWEDVGGLEDVKESLKEAVEWPLKSPECFKRIGIKPPRGILLYGPPGCGKTYIVQALANETGVNFIAIKGPELLSKWVGESEEHVRDVFRRAKQVAPSIVLFDEIDALAPRRGMDVGTRVTEQVVSQLLTEMSGIAEMEGVVVVATTNRPDLIDPALLRPGRFDKLVYVPAPDEKTRLEIFKVHTKNMPLKDVDLKKLTKETAGYSGADIEALCREAALFALREDIKSKNVTAKHFDKGLKKIKPSITEDVFARYQKAVEDLKKTKIEEEEKTGKYIG